MLKVLYAVVDKNGNFRRGKQLHVYVRRKTAERWCQRSGDSVVELVWDTDREPLYIKGVVVDGSPLRG